MLVVYNNSKNNFNKKKSQTNISGAKIYLHQITHVFTIIIMDESKKKCWVFTTTV
jgi:hypothetical protein